MKRIQGVGEAFLAWILLLVGTTSSFALLISDVTSVTRIHNESADVCISELGENARPHSVTITEFGAVGDGVTVNTHAFTNAIFYLNSFADKGGAQLYVPAGRWLTGSFKLVSHLTLFLDKDAVILGSQDPNLWPVIEPLPSYGRGRELPGGRHMSLIYGQNLTDVIITGDNGTIDGQGTVWWEMFHNKSLDYTRGPLLELVNSEGIIISNLTFKDSPFWNIHPVYCKNVLIQNLTILAPRESPNTDGIDPDSSTNVCIEDCFISNGDDLVSIKSGWDEYGIAYGRPSSNIVVRRVTGDTRSSAGISLGSEMSGGISDVYVEDLVVTHASAAIRVKGARGRGGYVTDIYFSNVHVTNAKWAIEFTSFYGEHPDENYDPNALPDVERIVIDNVVGWNVTRAGNFQGLEELPFREIYLTNIAVNVTASTYIWNCSYVEGYSDSVDPEPCPELQRQGRSVLPLSCSDRDDNNGTEI
ncbi:hypothetical protein L7F22_000517 [Adiantum nelumboides]|nr:hypothetical protein [Adiantum nelumboides]